MRKHVTKYGFLLAMAVGFLSGGCRKTPASCSEEGYIIIDYVTNCDFLIMMSTGEVYQPVNLNRFGPAFADSQKVTIDYNVLMDPPTCNAIAKIELLCLADAQ